MGVLVATMGEDKWAKIPQSCKSTGQKINGGKIRRMMQKFLRWCWQQTFKHIFEVGTNNENKVSRLMQALKQI